MDQGMTSAHPTPGKQSGSFHKFAVPYLMGVLAVGLLLFTASAYASPLNLVVGKPDIAIGPLSLNYNAGTDLFSIVNGTASLFTGTDNVARPIGLGDYDLSATINGSGVLQAGGTFSIAGTIPSLGINSTTTLLAGNLTSFGFSPDPATGTAAAFEFLFTKTSSVAALGFGNTGGIKINAFSITPNPPGFTFASNWSTSSTNNSADNFAPVPEPATVLLLGSGAAVLLGFAGRRLQQQV